MWDSLRQVEHDWNQYAAADPLWAILTDPAKKGGKWEPEVFFETGRVEIAAVMEYVRTLGLEAGRGAALDFGCGVGRLSRALGDYFEHVVGVDISPVMVEQARRYHAGQPRCEFVQISDPGFAALPRRDFDFIYSNITLQHIPPRHSQAYVAGLLGLLRPGGLMVFQLAAESRATAPGRLWQAICRRWRRMKRGAEPVMEMYGVPQRRVLKLLERQGGQVLDVQANESAGPEWTSYRYAVVRRV
jgi:SAM-dependent methyltransferase